MLYPYNPNTKQLKEFKQKIRIHPLVLFCNYDCDGLMGV
ncbi:hypothetical protein HBZS_118850 [Helicobacter bizzozeronii CCUG 35545]|nr:hypothetical protein HBZS_118850 [Helicobacter bizzozeronii CCUG 35545]